MPRKSKNPNYIRKKAKPKDPQSEFIRFKSESLRAAKELCYSHEIAQLIEDAETEGEIVRALMRGRSEMR